MKKLLVASVAAGLAAVCFCAQMAYAQDIQVCTGSGGGLPCSGYGSIQAAIDNAPNDAVIVIPEGVRTEADIKIEDKNLTIRGASPRGTVVQAASYPCAVPGRVFQISSARVTIEDLTVRYGCVLSPMLPSVGGGIWNAGALTLRRVIVTENSVHLTDEGIEAGKPWTPRGGGIYSVGSLVVSDSTIFSNSVSTTAGTAYGGGLYNNGNATIANSTIGENQVIGSAGGGQLAGGGLYNAGTLAMEYTTVVKNSAAEAGGAIWSSGEIALINNLIYADLPADSQVVCGQGPGRSCAPPILGPVELGLLRQETRVPVYIPTRTSASVDAGRCALSKSTVDQRGSGRNQGNECDLGSVELGFSFMPVLVASPPMADLIVHDVTIEPSGPLDSGTQVTIKVIIENIGNKATNRGFYIDLFINPRETPPNRGGYTWADFCRSERCVEDEGIVWQAPLTLFPGERFTFTSNIDVDQYALRLSSKWDKYFAAGDVKLWAFVDSYEANRSPQGYIVERREDNNRYEVSLFTVSPGRLPDAVGDAGAAAGDLVLPSPLP